MTSWTDEDAKKYFIEKDNVFRKILENMKSFIGRNYKDVSVLDYFYDLSKISHGFNNDLKSNSISKPFNMSLMDLLCLLDNEEVASYFIKSYLSSQVVKDPKIDIRDSKALIKLNEDNSFSFFVKLPSDVFDNDLLCAAYAHELTHFSMFLHDKIKDRYEHSEVLSIFVEYLMYKVLGTSENFFNNRLSLLKENFLDLSDDLEYARFPNRLEIDRNLYTGSLIGEISYIDSFEYVLNLINREKTDSKEVYKSISRLLLGTSNTDIEGKKLDFDINEHEEIKKLIKINKC